MEAQEVVRFSARSGLTLKKTVILNKLTGRTCVRDLPKHPTFFLDNCEGDSKIQPDRGFIVRNVRIMSKTKMYKKNFSHTLYVAVIFESRLIGGLESFTALKIFPQREFSLTARTRSTSRYWKQCWKRISPAVKAFQRVH